MHTADSLASEDVLEAKKSKSDTTWLHCSLSYTNSQGARQDFNAHIPLVKTFTMEHHEMFSKDTLRTDLSIALTETKPGHFIDKNQINGELLRPQRSGAQG